MVVYSLLLTSPVPSQRAESSLRSVFAWCRCRGRSSKYLFRAVEACQAKDAHCRKYWQAYQVHPIVKQACAWHDLAFPLHADSTVPQKLSKLASCWSRLGVSRQLLGEREAALLYERLLLQTETSPVVSAP